MNSDFTGVAILFVLFYNFGAEHDLYDLIVKALGG